MWGVAYAAEPIGALASFAAGVLVFVGLVFAFRAVTPEEIAFIRSTVARATTRFR
jgi:hypothetical protein